MIDKDKTDNRKAAEKDSKCSNVDTDMLTSHSFNWRAKES